MAMENVNYRLLQSIVAGAQKVISEKDELNKINVFPVADGDTGSNLSSLMQAIIDNVPAKNYPIHVLLDEVSSAALRGARGNSGIIFAQYLNAVSENYKTAETNIERLVEAFGKAVSKAYSALIEPREGTILSVMRIWSESLVKNYKSNASFEDSLLNAKTEAQAAVIATQFQMSILKKNKLVDSGAKGFYYFIAGFTDFYCGKTVGEASEKAQAKQEIEKEVEVVTQHLVAEIPKNRYCSEFIIKEPQIREEKLKTMLKEKGDSLVIAGNSEHIKIHIHTNQPQSILSFLASYGKIIYQKVDDMRLQYEISQNKKSPIAIVTDSIADLPRDFVLGHQIHVLPINISLEDQNFLDKLTINPQIVREKSRDEIKMTTSQPSIQTVDALFSFLEDKYEKVLVITVSSQLSGTYQLIAQRIKAKGLSEDWIHLVDSRLNSVAQGLLVKQAAYLAEKGEPVSLIIEKIEKMIARIFIYVAVEDLAPMIRSGRIPKLLGEVAQKLSLHPIISLDQSGKGKLIGASFSQKQSMNKILKKVTLLMKKGKIEELAVTHVLADESILWLNEKLSKETGKVCAPTECSAAIAISAGMGSVAIAGLIKEDV